MAKEIVKKDSIYLTEEEFLDLVGDEDDEASSFSLIWEDICTHSRMNPGDRSCRIALIDGVVTIFGSHPPTVIALVEALQNKASLLGQFVSIPTRQEFNRFLDSHLEEHRLLPEFFNKKK